MMRLANSLHLIAFALILLVPHDYYAHLPSLSPTGRLLRRQSGEGEQESTTPKDQTGGNTQVQPTSTNNDGSQATRLYPDLPRQPNYLPAFNAPMSNGILQAPIVPFGVQMPPPNRLNLDQQPAPFGRLPPQPRPMTAAERLQSQSFADGLGKRLLSLVGINTESQGASSGDNQPQDVPTNRADGMADSAMKALQNSTVLQQLNKGLHSIYGGLSKMYNSTVQEQVNMLQERFKSETENSTNPWHQRMAQQVPTFFKQMATKVGEAQEQLNKVWRDLNQANATSIMSRSNGQSRSFFGTQWDNFMSGNPMEPGFFNQFSRSFEQNNPMAENGPQNGNGDVDLSAKLREIWQVQVQPQLGMIRNQMTRVWRDLTASGALSPETVLRSRSSNNNVESSKNASSDLIDNILKEVDIGGPEYALVEAKTDGETAPETSSPAGDEKAKQSSGQTSIKLSPQMQNRLVEAQRELNQLWMGLTNSLQGALANVKSTLNPQPHYYGMNPMASNSKPVEVDPNQNEISDKIKDLSKVQRDADMVYAAVQQQQQEAQQRQTLSDRFKNFMTSVDMSSVNQLPDRIGEQFNRFGNAVGNFWNRLPERWDNFMTSARRPQESQAARMNTGTTSTTTTTTTTSAPSER